MWKAWTIFSVYVVSAFNFNNKFNIENIIHIKYI